MAGKGVKNLHVWSNIIEKNYRSGILTWDSPGMSNLYIYNNTIANNGTGNLSDVGRGGIVLTSGSNFNIKNNIFWDNRPNDSRSNQIYSGLKINSLESNSFFHNSKTPDMYYLNGFKDVEEVKQTLKMDNDHIVVKGTRDGLNPNNDFKLDGSHINNGQSLTDCFNVKIQGENYRMCYSDALDPARTNWNTKTPIVNTTKQDQHGSWERGAYAFLGSGKDNTSPPQEDQSNVPQAPEGVVIQEIR
jgi:hypothetical protein